MCAVTDMKIAMELQDSATCLPTQYITHTVISLTWYQWYNIANLKIGDHVHQQLYLQILYAHNTHIQSLVHISISNETFIREYRLQLINSSVSMVRGPVITHNRRSPDIFIHTRRMCTS